MNGSSTWDTEAATFDDAPDHGLLDATVRAAWKRLLSDSLPTAPTRIADLGCGTGTLSLLLAEQGHLVDGVDFSPEMIKRAEAKAGGRAGVRFVRGDAYDPPLTTASYDVVLCRHVLWAMPDPATALSRWTKLLEAPGILLLVEGRWSNDAGLTSDQTVALVEGVGRTAELTVMSDPVFWGREIDDERYLVVGRVP